VSAPLGPCWRRRFDKALDAADTKQFLASLSADPGGGTPEAFAKLLKDEHARWAAVAQKVDIEKQ